MALESSPNNTIVLMKQRALIFWMLDPAERDAKLAKEALRKKGVRSMQVIIEISCASPPCHLLAIRKAYCSLFRCSLEEDIALYIAKPLRKVSQPN